MANLTGPRDSSERAMPEARYDSYQLADGVTVYKGGAAAMNASGMAQPVVGSGAALSAGRFEQNLVAGSGNAFQVSVKSGTFTYNNGDSITLADRGKSCYFGDDNTVFKANTGGKPVAGKIYDVTAAGVQVSIISPLNIPALGVSGASSL